MEAILNIHAFTLKTDKCTLRVPLKQEASKDEVHGCTEISTVGHSWGNIDVVSYYIYFVHENSTYCSVFFLEIRIALEKCWCYQNFPKALKNNRFLKVCLYEEWSDFQLIIVSPELLFHLSQKLWYRFLNRRRKIIIINNNH